MRDEPPVRTATLHTIPIAPRPTNKEAVIQFLTQLRDDVEAGKCPISDIIVLAIETTEFTTQTSMHTATRMSRYEIIGHLHAMATEVTMEMFDDASE